MCKLYIKKKKDTLIGDFTLTFICR